MANPLWQDDEVQFPRLIAEIEAVGGFTEALVQDLQTSMDLQEEHVFELIDRAQQRWDDIKEQTVAAYRLGAIE